MLIPKLLPWFATLKVIEESTYNLHMFMFIFKVKNYITFSSTPSAIVFIKSSSYRNHPVN